MLCLVGDGYTWSSTCCISLGMVTHGVVHVVSRISLGEGYTWSSTCCISLGMVTHGVVHVVSRWGGTDME